MSRRGRALPMNRSYKVSLIILGVAAVGVGSFFGGRETALSTTAKRGTSASTTTPSGSSTTTTTTAPSATTVETLCYVSGLQITQTGTGAAAGTVERTFSLRNISSTKCTIYGYPGMLLLGPGSASEKTAVERGGAESFENIGPSTVTLAPEAAAYFNVGYSDVMPPCSTATAVEITPPTNATHIVVDVVPRTSVCSGGTLHVSAVFSSTDAAAMETRA